MKKVWISGCGIVSSLGHNKDDVFESLRAGNSAVRYSEEWSQYTGLHSHLYAPIDNFSSKSRIPRSVRRTMSPMSEYAAVSALDALEEAQLDLSQLSDTETQRTLILMGSTTGSPGMYEKYFKKAQERGGPEGQMGTSFFKVMNHSIAANVAATLNFQGPYQGPSCACATSAQTLILAWELIQSGLYDRVICGGGDELHYTSTGVFDIVLAASRSYNEKPEATPRPFDKDRDGLVVSEGGAALILESQKSLEERKVTPLAEFKGGSYSGSGAHMSQSNAKAMQKVLRDALNKSQVEASEVDYINAHATGTLQGDAAEAEALGALFGDQIPVSSLKGHFGHALAPCGAMEVIASLKMMEEGVLIGTRNLENIADECQGIKLFRENIAKNSRCMLSTNFAFGGMNTALLFSAVQ